MFCSEIAFLDGDLAVWLVQSKPGNQSTCTYNVQTGHLGTLEEPYRSISKYMAGSYPVLSDFLPVKLHLELSYPRPLHAHARSRSFGNSVFLRPSQSCPFDAPTISITFCAMCASFE